DSNSSGADGPGSASSTAGGACCESSAAVVEARCPLPDSPANAGFDSAFVPLVPGGVRLQAKRHATMAAQSTLMRNAILLLGPIAPGPSCIKPPAPIAHLPSLDQQLGPS